MRPERIHEIERLALDALENAYGSKEAIMPPIDIDRVAQSLNLSLKQGVFNDEQVMGSFDRKMNTIYVSDRDTLPRQLFTIAHEIGHHQLHHDKQAEVFYRKDMAVIDREDREIEREANCFAASLLMPEYLVRSYWATFKDIQILADAFRVSYTAMKFRLQNLGIIEE